MCRPAPGPAPTPGPRRACVQAAPAAAQSTPLAQARERSFKPAVLVLLHPMWATAGFPAAAAAAAAADSYYTPIHVLHILILITCLWHSNIPLPTSPLPAPVNQGCHPACTVLAVSARLCLSEAFCLLQDTEDSLCCGTVACKS